MTKTKHYSLLLSALVLIACTSGNGQKEAKTQHEHWVCLHGEHRGAEIALARIGYVFRGEYIDPAFQDRFSIPIMGTIDEDGNMFGVSASTSSDELYGKISGKISGNTFHAVWLPTPTATGEFREMELQLSTLSSLAEAEISKHPDTFYNMLYSQCAYIDMISGKSLPRTVPFAPLTPFTQVAYGYSIGEWERRHIYVGAGSKAGETEFHLHIVESGMSDVDLYITGVAPLHGNKFRYREQSYQFEVTVYNGFIIIKTISGNLDGVVADGIYPGVMPMSFYRKFE